MFSKFKNKKDAKEEDFFQRGNNHYADGNTQKAIKYYTKAINCNADHINAYYKRGRCHVGFGNFNYAILDFNEALERDKNNINVLTHRGIAHQRMGNFDAAKQDLTLAISLTSGNNELAYEARGLIFYHTGELNNAITDFTKAIEIEENCYRYKFRGDAYCANNQFELAAQDYQKAYKLKPDINIDANNLQLCGLKKVGLSHNGIFKSGINQTIVNQNAEDKCLKKNTI